MRIQVPLTMLGEPRWTPPPSPCTHDEMTQHVGRVTGIALRAVYRAGLTPSIVSFSDEVASEINIDVTDSKDRQLVLVFDSTRLFRCESDHVLSVVATAVAGVQK